MANNHRESGQNYPEKLILDFSRYIISRVNSYSYQKYAIEQDDLLQSIYVKIYKIFEKNEKKIGFQRSYINRIVDSVVIEAIKRSRRETKALNELNHTLTAGQGLAHAKSLLQSSDVKEIVLNSLAELEESRRCVINLYLSGMDFDEIARLQKWSLGKTSSLFYRGLKDLKRKLEKRGIFYEN